MLERVGLRPRPPSKPPLRSIALAWSVREAGLLEAFEPQLRAAAGGAAQPLRVTADLHVTSSHVTSSSGSKSTFNRPTEFSALGPDRSGASEVRTHLGRLDVGALLATAATRAAEVDVAEGAPGPIAVAVVVCGPEALVRAVYNWVEDWRSAGRRDPQGVKRASSQTPILPAIAPEARTGASATVRFHVHHETFSL